MLLDLIDKAGNLFDLPGSMVRDALTLNNPLDQLLSPLSSDNRMDGRDVLEKWGMLGPNTEGLDVGDVAGTAAGIALDPLTWVSGAGVMRLLGRGSKSAKAGTGTKAAQALLEAPTQSRALVPYRSPLQSVLQGPTSPMTPLDADPFAIMREAMGQPKPAALPAPAPVFYSRLRRAVEQLPDNPNGFKSQSVLNMLKKAPEGISMDEFNYSGLPKQLEHTPLVSKAMLLDALDDSPVDVRTLQLNKGNYKYTGPNYTREQLQNALNEATRPDHTYVNPLYPERGESLSWPLQNSENIGLLSRLLAGVDAGRTVGDEVMDLGFVPYLLRGNDLVETTGGRVAKWSQYAMPGAKDYRESLLQETRNIVPFEEEMSRALGAARQRLDEGEIQPHNFAAISNGWNRKKGRVGYRSPHWDDADVTAHLRTSTRNVQDNSSEAIRPTHFIDELQSDWHQEGRKFDEIRKANDEWTAVNKQRYKLMDEVQARQLREWGYTDDDLLADEWKLRSLWNKTTEYRGRSQDIYEYMTDAERAAVQKIDGRLEQLHRIIAPWERGDLDIEEVPLSPFRNAWQDLGLKRALYDAAAQGSDGIGWSIGEDIQKIVGGKSGGQEHFYDTEIGNRLRKLLAGKGQKNAKAEVRGLPDVIGGGDNIDYTGMANYMAIDPQTRARILAEGFPLLSLPFLAAFGLTGGEQRGVQ